MCSEETCNFDYNCVNAHACCRYLEQKIKCKIDYRPTVIWVIFAVLVILMSDYFC